jgi:lipopolysaccharide/colanic/teichoic acid biosynthesis glycosyltransferase
MTVIWNSSPMAARQLGSTDGIRIETAGSDQGPTYVVCKRLLDAVGAIVLLLVLAPLLLLIAALIKADDGGPVLFRQERVGSRRRKVNGRTVWEIQTFRIFKFRSMIQNADEAIHREYIRAFTTGEAKPSEEKGPKFKLNNDARITRVGRFLRRTSFDELPQLVNVLRGEMSLVGPRPVPTYEVAQYENWHFERLAALPGITGLWQVNGRGEVSFEEMVRLDIAYVRGQSIWQDLLLLLRTVPIIWNGRGAK